MRDLIYYVASTLDGLIAHHDGSFDDWPWDDVYGADLAETFPDTNHKSYPSGHMVLYYRVRR